MSEVIDKKPAAKSARILNPQRIGLRENKRQDFVVNAEDGTTIEEVLDPQYWAHAVQEKGIESCARVEVMLETGEWMLDLLVINAGRNWAQVHVLHRYDLETRSESMPSAIKHRVEWKGPQLKWCVIRNADNEIIQKDQPSKNVAGEWLANYEKVTSA